MTTRRMTLKHIEAFRIVMQTGSMTEAARRLHTSQPQVSRLVSQLEAIVGFLLFERRGTRLLPSLDGKRFFQDVEKAFVGLEGLEGAASNIRSFGGDRLAVAAMPRIAGGLLSKAVAQFKAEHPEALLTIHSGAAATVNTWVSSGLCELGLAILYGDDVPGMQVQTLLTMDCVAVLPIGHRLAKRKQVAAADLEGEAFVSFPLGSAPRERIDRVLAAAGARTRTVLESDLGASVCALVAAGLGVSVLNPLAALEERRNLELAVRAFVPAIPVRLALLLPPDAPDSRLVSAFADQVRAVIASDLEVIRPYRR
ncbi:LysR substrate-binding domain-containing protein [Variovorax sp.]|uniref:LysR substrate-binding domain-containing protein n=1 Tax=Variovorax sp. TaxID=1871043 RepID=UPI0025DF504C|nr:LysR substrate-binding domain-containing protein [Variovorax sp.]